MFGTTKELMNHRPQPYDPKCTDHRRQRWVPRRSTRTSNYSVAEEINVPLRGAVGVINLSQPYIDGVPGESA